MNREKAIQFCQKYQNKKFYQPVIFVPDIIEIKGKWNKSTKQLASFILQDVEGKSILDLGCMHGYFLHEAINRGANQATGVEYDPTEIQIAHEINNILDNRIALIQCDLEDFIPTQSFDIILMMNIIHVLKDPVQTIKRFSNFVKDVLIIEHRPEHEQYFPILPKSTVDSPRSAGYRKLSYFNSFRDSPKA